MFGAWPSSTCLALLIALIADIALRLHSKTRYRCHSRFGAAQGLGIDGDSVKRLTNVVERRLGFLEIGWQYLLRCEMEGARSSEKLVKETKMSNS